MFDPVAEYERTMAHLIELAKEEGWKGHVWARVQEIDGDPGFVGFKSDFLERVKQ